MASQPVPRFRSSWSEQMTSFLKRQPAAYTVNNIEAICDSWGDTYKFDRVTRVIIDVLGIDHEDLDHCIQYIEGWAGADEDWF